MTDAKVIAVEVKAMRNYVQKNVRDAVVSINDLDGSWTMKWSTGEKSGKGFMQLMQTYEFLKKVKGGSMRSKLAQHQPKKAFDSPAMQRAFEHETQKLARKS